MPTLQPLPKLSEFLRELLEIGSEYRLPFENLSFPSPKCLGQTHPLEPLKPIGTGRDLFQYLLEDQVNYKLRQSDLIRRCVTPVDIFNLVYHVHDFKGVEIPFFTHVLINRHTGELFVPVMDTHRKVKLVDLEHPWPSYCKVILRKQSAPS